MSQIILVDHRLRHLQAHEEDAHPESPVDEALVLGPETRALPRGVYHEHRQNNYFN